MASAVCLPAWTAGASPAENVSLSQIRDHPRLLVPPDRFESFTARLMTESELNRRYAVVKERAVEPLDQPPIDYAIPDGKRLLSVSREVLDRVYTLSLVFQIERDRRFLDRAWRELKHAAGFKDWNPSHFLDTAEMTHAFAIGYDWLFDEWSMEQRDTIRAAIIRHGLTPGLHCYRGEAGYGWWTGAVHNWNQVCNGGMILGALAIAEDENELAATIVTQAVRLLPKAMAEYAPAGGYKEGESYWEYGTSYNVLAIAALESALGSDFGLTKARGFDVTGHFPVFMTSPTGHPFNFSDCKGSRARRSAALYWLGKRFNQPMWLWHAEQYSKESPGALDLLWRTQPPRDFDAGAQRRAMAWPAVEAFTMRGSWTDPQTTFVGFKGGHPADNHAQADLGTFVLDAQGVRWAVDLGPDNYNLPGYFDRANRRWHFYRNRAEGHNTLVINPDEKPDQVVASHARLVAIETDGDQPFAVADLTPAYVSKAERVTRGVRLIDGRDVLVQDELEGKAMDVHWFMHTRAKIELSDNGHTATLQQDGRTLTVRLLEPSNTRFEVLVAQPFPTSPTVKGQQANADVRKLAIRLREAGDCRIVVWFSPVNTKPPQLESLKQWRAK